MHLEWPVHIGGKLFFFFFGCELCFGSGVVQVWSGQAGEGETRFRCGCQEDMDAGCRAEILVLLSKESPNSQRPLERLR